MSSAFNDEELSRHYNKIAELKKTKAEIETQHTTQLTQIEARIKQVEGQKNVGSCTLYNPKHH